MTGRPGDPAVGPGDGPDGPADEALAAELAAALADRRAPAEVVDRAKALFTWRTIDAELAALAHDSLVDEDTVGVRSGDGPRTLAFEAGDLEIEVEVVPGRGARRLVGQLAPAGAAEIVLVLDDGTSTVRADDHGRFAADLPSAPVHVSLRVRIAGRAEIATVPTLL